MSGDANRRKESSDPSPTMADFIEVKVEQGAVAGGIMFVGAFAAFIVFVIGALAGFPAIAGAIALTIFFATIFMATFIGHDTNYTVARMDERARGENSSSPVPRGDR